MNFNDFIFFAPYNHTIKQIRIENEAIRQVLKDKYGYTDETLAPHFTLKDDNGWYREIRSFNANFVKLIKQVRKEKDVDCMSKVLDNYLNGDLGPVAKDLAAWNFTISYRPKTAKEIKNPKNFDIKYALLANNLPLTSGLLILKLNKEQDYKNVYEQFLISYYEAFDMLDNIKHDYMETKETKELRSKMKLRLAVLVNDVLSNLMDDYPKNMNINWSEKLDNKYGLIIIDLLKDGNTHLLDGLKKGNPNIDKVYRLLHYSNNPLKNKYKKFASKYTLKNPVDLEKEMLAFYQDSPSPKSLPKEKEEEESEDSDFVMH